MGWGPPAFAGDDPAVAEGKREAYRRMTDLGMPKEQALDLLARFDVERVGRQLDWLPRRNAKSPARFLAAAIEHDYEALPVVHLQQAPAPNDGPEPARRVLPAPGAESPSEGETSAPSTKGQEEP